MSDLFHNPHFWILIAFIIMLSLFSKKVYASINSILESKINDIINEIQKSKDLLNQAISLFSIKKIEFDNIKIKTTEILNRAQSNADILFDKTLTKIQNQIKHSKKSLTNYLDTKQIATQYDLNQKLLENSISNVKDIILSQIDNNHHSKIIDNSIDEIFKSINNKK
jgi:F0F1-type ATP synthase membrane subunit b/b'